MFAVERILDRDRVRGRGWRVECGVPKNEISRAEIPFQGDLLSLLDPAIPDENVKTREQERCLHGVAPTTRQLRTALHE